MWQQTPSYRILPLAVCGQLRGSSLFIFGLRVHEAARGRGLGSILMVRWRVVQPTCTDVLHTLYLIDLLYVSNLHAMYVIRVVLLSKRRL